MTGCDRHSKTGRHEQAHAVTIDARRRLRPAGIAFGGDYNPEQWPEEVWAEDVIPVQQMDFSRFSDNALLECYLAEKEVLRRITPDVPVTTNFIGVHKPVDAFRWAAEEDVVSIDVYQDPHARTRCCTSSGASPGAAPRSTTRRCSRTVAPASGPSGR